MTQDALLLSVGLAGFRPTDLVTGDGTVTGFEVDLPSGVTLSVQWHRHSYSSVGSKGVELKSDAATFEMMAWWKADGAVVSLGGNDDVMGWADRDEVRDVAQRLSRLVRDKQQLAAGDAPHGSDDDCSDTLAGDGSCTVCGVSHGEPCVECGGRGYHAPDCSECG